MATRILPPKNKTYYINPAHLTFNENTGYGPDFIQVSASSSCYISVYDPDNGIRHSDADRNFQRWKVTAYNNKFPNAGKWYICVRLERKGSSALVMYDQVERGVHGAELIEETDEDGNVTKVEGEYNEENFPYYYICIGEVSGTNGTTIREITYDTGYLESDQGRSEDTSALSEMWKIVKDGAFSFIQAQKELLSFTVKGIVTLMGGLSFRKGEQEKLLTDVATASDKENEEAVSDTVIATTSWVSEKFAGISDDKYIRKDQDDSTEFSLSVGGSLSAGEKIVLQEKPIEQFTRFEDEEKPEQASDSEIYSALMTETRIEDEINALDDKFLRKDQDDATEYSLSVGENLAVGGNVDFQGKTIAAFTRFSDEEKPITATDVAFYSSLMTDKRIEEEIEGLNEKYLRKDVKDTAHKEITFEEGITVYELAKMMKIEVTQLATIAQAVIKAGEGFSESISSADFVDGFFGEGFRIWHDLAAGNWNMTLDNLTVRKAMMIYELIIQKIRAVGGMLVVSAGNGRIKEVEKVGLEYKITFEDTNTFAENDLMRCQVFSQGQYKNYWVEVYRVSGDSVYVRTSEFAEFIPEAGDEVVLMGNTRNKLRQNLILISATEDGQPRFDCLDGVNSKNFENCLKVRVGALDGIRDDRFPAEMQPQGYGLYGNNCYLTGVFVLSTGVEVGTQFSIMEGMIRSEVSSVRSEINAKNNYLSNASFTENLNLWEFDNDVRVFDTSGGLLHFNDEFYSNKRVFAGVVVKDSKNVLRIKNSYICQRNEDYGLRPTFDKYKDEETEEELYRPRMFYVSFKYLVSRPGILTIHFINESGKDEFEEYESIYISESISETISFSIMEREGKWNGSGDFYLSFTGDIYIYDLALSDNALADVEEKFASRFEQTDKKIQANLEAIIKNGQTMEEYYGELVLRADRLESSFTKKLTDQYSKITNEYSSSISQTATEIRSEVSALETSIDGQFRKVNSSITQTAESIRAEVSELEEDLSGQISESKSSITQTAKEIRSEVSALSTDLNGKITAANSSITQTANSIRLEVSELEEDLSGQISENKSSITQTAKEIRSEVSALSTDLNGKITAANSSITQTASSIRLEVSELEGNLSGQISENKSFITQTAKEIRSEVSSLSADLDGKITAANSSITQTAKEIRSEVSSIETDLSGRITTAEGSITTQAGQIALKASQTTVDSLTDRVSTAESSIEMNTGNIELKVSKDGVISSINQSPESVTINASKINLQGKVTISMLANETVNKIDSKATGSDIATAVNGLKNSLGSLAYESMIGAAKLDSTVIEGGYIKTSLINASAIKISSSNVTGLGSLAAKDSVSASDVSGLGSLATYNSVEAAMGLSQTIIVGGYINTSLIDADKISTSKLVTKADSSGHVIDIANGRIWMTKDGYTSVQVNADSVQSAIVVSGASKGTSTMNCDGFSYVPKTGGSTSINSGGITLNSGACITGLAVNTVDIVTGTSSSSLPSASLYPGKVVFVKKTGGSLTASNVYLADESTRKSSYTWSSNTKARLFLSDGSSWYEFYCGT